MEAQPPIDQVREFVIAGHGNLAKVKAMLAENPALLHAAYEWKPGDTETAIQAAAHVGSVATAEYLLGQGAPLDIPTAAMLRCRRAVQELLGRDPNLIRAVGAHGIPLLTHAAFSGDLELVELLYKGGARDGISAALFNAVSREDEALTRWFLENGEPNLEWRDFQEQTALMLAADRKLTTIVELLTDHAARFQNAS